MYQLPTSFKTARPLTLAGQAVAVGTTLTRAQLRSIKRLAPLLCNGTIQVLPDPHFRHLKAGRSIPVTFSPQMLRKLTTELPVARFTSSVTKLSVAFDATTSSDASGSITTYLWDFGDQTPIVIATAKTITHVYEEAGTYEVALFVVDNDYAASEVVTHEVTAVANVAPTAGFTSEATGLSVAFTDTSEDSDGTVEEYSWDFGDGSEPDTTANPTHVYAEAGTYTVTLTVTDDEGLTDEASADVTVAEEE